MGIQLTIVALLVIAAAFYLYRRISSEVRKKDSGVCEKCEPGTAPKQAAKKKA